MKALFSTKSYSIELALSIPGYTDADDLEWLYDQATAVPPHLAVVEIGSYLGRSTVALAAGRATVPNAPPVWTIDHFHGSPEHITAGLADNLYERFVDNVIRTGMRSNVAVIQGDSFGVARRGYIRDIGFLFLDGAHEYEAVRDDLVAWIPLIMRGCGILAVHDYVSERWTGVKRAVDNNTSTFDPIEAVASIWAGRRK